MNWGKWQDQKTSRRPLILKKPKKKKKKAQHINITPTLSEEWPMKKISFGPSLYSKSIWIKTKLRPKENWF